MIIRNRLARIAEMILRRHRFIMVAFHVYLVAVSFALAWILAFNFSFPEHRVFLALSAILIFIRIVVLNRFSLLHGHWSFTDVNDATDIVKATFIGSIAFLVIVRFVLRLADFPPQLYIIEPILSGALLAGVRLGFRILAEVQIRDRQNTVGHRKQVVIIGAGFAGQMIIRELAHDGQYNVVGFVDDDPTKRGLKIQGKPVLAPVSELAEIAARYAINEVLIAVPSATGSQMTRFVTICQNSGLKFLTVPRLTDLLSGRARINELHEVDLDDLLGREPTSIDAESVRNSIANKVVLVTGAAGSIGSELCRQIVQLGPASLICVDQSETDLFYLEMELRGSSAAERAVYCVADYTNPERMRGIFKQHQIQIIFHAAAYKHVPLMETNLQEAVQNNVLGLLALLDVAQRSRCEALVLISSDKAVNPTSVMGCTKRICELIMASQPDTGVRCVSVRFGNVLGSQGSVVPVFQRLLAEGKPITITHPAITRFFMTIREAVSLVLQASAIGKHRDILVLDMGEPIKIVDLARTLVRLSGKPETEAELVFTGLRPGEKLYEELFYNEEELLDTSFKAIKRTSSTMLSWIKLKQHLEDLRSLIATGSGDHIRIKLQEIVPEYSFSPTETVAITGMVAINMSEVSDLSETQYASATGDD